MSAKSTYRDAIIDDGRRVLYEVTSRLYKGGFKRPDIYFQKEPQLRNKNYNQIFDAHQRQTIAWSGSAESYDIEEAARRFDVPIHAAIIKHTCGLGVNDPLLRKVEAIKSYRNSVCHPSDLTERFEYQCNSEPVTDENLNENLQDLLELYEGIIDDLDAKTMDDLTIVKYQVRSMIKERMIPEIVTYSRGTSSHLVSNHNAYVHRTEHRTTDSKESDGIPTWGKVAIGLTAGITALALGAAAANSNESEAERRRRMEARRNQTRNNNNQEECSVM